VCCGWGSCWLREFGDDGASELFGVVAEDVGPLGPFLVVFAFLHLFADFFRDDVCDEVAVVDGDSLWDIACCKQC